MSAGSAVGSARSVRTWLLVSSTTLPSRRSYITAPAVPAPPPAVPIWHPPTTGRRTAVSTSTKRGTPTSTTSVRTSLSSIGTSDGTRSAALNASSGTLPVTYVTTAGSSVSSPPVRRVPAPTATTF
ncbi:hypothetical protein FE697_000635 [Mumia zhuanghuii]|uniref:Uncharacterized protein n=2 Tax=Mumia TaxID=1546255 RepID=A0ABW1QPX2_9ACTN|nr:MULTISPECIES: hypothetical protein [Mumia]KAA1424476.1 hypothetical protein FE697_000635 [Mumia zhuanghuii]